MPQALKGHEYRHMCRRQACPTPRESVNTILFRKKRYCEVSTASAANAYAAIAMLLRGPNHGRSAAANRDRTQASIAWCKATIARCLLALWMPVKTEL